MSTKRVYIPEGIDKRYRRALLAALVKAGPKAAWHIRNALIDGPSRGGALESMQHFGKDLDVKLKVTAPIVDSLEVSCPGIKQWLAATGFGDDKNMIKGFIAWSEYVNSKAEFIIDADRVFHAE
jgi:hypothetical protein